MSNQELPTVREAMRELQQADAVGTVVRRTSVHSERTLGPPVAERDDIGVCPYGLIGYVTRAGRAMKSVRSVHCDCLGRAFNS